MRARTPRAIARPGPRAARLALLLSAAVLVTSCALSRPAPVKNMFLIEPATPPAAARAHPLTLRVGAINVAAPFRGRAFVYRDSELRYATDYYSEFLVAPGAMVGEATARALEGAHVFTRVVAPGASPDGDYVLDGFVGALYGDVRDPAMPVAEVTITYYLTRAEGGTVTPMWSKEYRRHAPVAGAVPESYTAALSAAVGDILAELARDLAAANLPKK